MAPIGEAKQYTPPNIEMGVTMPLLKGTGTCREDDTRRLAYELYVDRIRKGEAGGEIQDWLEAERRSNMEIHLSRAVEWIGEPI